MVNAALFLSAHSCVARAGASRSPRSLPPSSDLAASSARNHQKEIAAPPRRSAATRQWIKEQPEIPERKHGGDPQDRSSPLVVRLPGS